MELLKDTSDKPISRAEENLKLFFYYIHIIKKRSTIYGHVPNVDQILKIFKDSMT